MEHVSESELGELLGTLYAGTLYAIRDGQDPYDGVTAEVRTDNLVCERRSPECLAQYTQLYKEGEQLNKRDPDAPPMASGADIIALDLLPEATIRRQTLLGLMREHTSVRSVVLKRVDLRNKNGSFNRKLANETYNEIAINYFLNTLVLRRLSHGFMLLVDWFRCVDASKVKKACDKPRTPKKIKLDTQYIVLENVDENLDVFIARKPALGRLRAALLQVVHALDVAWRTNRFVHYDLHGNNLMLTRKLAGSEQAWLLASDRTTKAYDTWYSMRSGEQGEMMEEEESSATTDESSSSSSSSSRGGEMDTWYFQLPHELTEARLVKLIDFGTSHMWVSDNKEQPTATSREQASSLDENGIRQTHASPFYDLRRLLFDLMARIIPTSHWKTIKDSTSKKAWADFLAFCSDALDGPRMLAFLRDEKKQNTYREAKGNASLTAKQKDTFNISLSIIENTVTDPNSLLEYLMFELQQPEDVAVTDTPQNMLFNFLWTRYILVDDARMPTNEAAVDLKEAGGLTPRDALMRAFFKPLRVRTKDQLDILQAERLGGSWPPYAKRINLTLAEAGTEEFVDKPSIQTRYSGRTASCLTPCMHCRARPAAHECTRCRHFRYCSPNCATMDWRMQGRHRRLCGHSSSSFSSSSSSSATTTTL